MRINSLFMMLAILLCATVAFAAVAVYDDGTYKGEASSIDFTDNAVSFDGSKATITSATPAGSYKYAYIPIGYVGATQDRVGGIGNDLVCVGLTAGADEIGSTEGYAVVDDAADYLRFQFPMPSNFYDGGLAGDFLLSLDLSEVGTSATCTVNTRVFERGSTTAIYDGLIVLDNGDTRGFSDLTLTGDNASLDKDDVLVVEVTGVGDTDDFAVYGARVKYRPGLDYD